MDSGAYLYLQSMGFSKKELEQLEENEFIWETSRNRCDFIVNFFLEKDFTIDEIHKYFMEYPNIVSEHPNRLIRIDELLDNIEFTNEDKKKLVFTNYEIYSANPLELKKIIDFLKDGNEKELKKVMFINSEYLAEDFEKVKVLIRK